VSDQLRIPATLAPGKEPPYTLSRRLRLLRMFLEMRKSPSTGIRTTNRPAYTVVGTPSKPLLAPNNKRKHQGMLLRVLGRIKVCLYSSDSQPPGPGINYTGPREVLLEFVILFSKQFSRINVL